MRTKVSVTTDHGNNLRVAQFVFSFLHAGFFRESSIEMDVKNCQCYCKKQIESLFSLGIFNELHGQAIDIFWNQPFLFVFTERNSLFASLYQTSKLYHKPGLTTLAFALICSQSFQECSNFVVNQIFNFTTRQKKY